MIDVGRTALLLLDFQNYGVHPDGYWAARDPAFFDRIVRSNVVGKAGRALRASRDAGIPVFHVVNRWRPGHVDLHPGMPMWAGRKGTDVAVEGTWGAEIVDALAPDEGEPVVVKRSVGAFAGTELDRLLTLRRSTMLVLCGVATNFVVEGTAREAADRGFDIVVLADACESISDAWQRFSLELLATVGAVMFVDDYVVAIGRSNGPEPAA